MRSSETIGALAEALAAAQGEFQAVPKTADNPFFKSKYADLPDVVMAASPILSKHGLAVTQLPDFDGEHDLLTTRVVHKSGEWIEASMRLYLPKADAQGQGSAITYGRRYSYSGGVGVVTDVDDDGNAASRAQHPTSRPQPSRRETHSTVRRPPARADTETGEIAEPSPDAASQKQLGMIAALFNDKKFLDDRTVRHLYVAEIVGREFKSTKDLTRREASKVIEALMAEPVQQNVPPLRDGEEAFE